MFNKYMEYMGATAILLLILIDSVIVGVEIAQYVGKFCATIISITSFGFYSFLIFPNWIKGSK